MSTLPKPKPTRSTRPRTNQVATQPIPVRFQELTGKLFKVERDITQVEIALVNVKEDVVELRQALERLIREEMELATIEKKITDREKKE